MADTEPETSLDQALTDDVEMQEGASEEHGLTEIVPEEPKLILFAE